MSCYYPLKAFVLGTNPETGKHIIKVVSRDFDGNEYSKAGFRQIPIPCGHCIGCRLKYSRIWADRMLAESLYHESNYFVTLTYDNDHLPPCRDGSPVHSLVKRDVQLFMKRLRKMFPEQKIRFYACGEYGSESMRPHYHLILFGLKLNDLTVLSKNKLNQFYFTSESFSKLWTFGFHIITSVSWDTCAYVARYVTKKQTGVNSSVYEKYNFAPEFSLMSNKPGIGRDFFDDRKEELYAYGSISLPDQQGSKKILPNKYYDNLFDIEYPEVMDSIKQQRVDMVNEYNAVKSNLTSLSYNDLLLTEEINKKAAITSLKRKEL